MIRRAITDNALVFIACFSARSVARVKSYQNVELALAIEQLQLRRPDDPWLIPVRFDDCDIPDLDLGAGRTLASIQRADLFGDGRYVGIGRLVRAVVRLLEWESPEGSTVGGNTDSRVRAAQYVDRFPGFARRHPPRITFSGRAEVTEKTSEAEALETLKRNPLEVSGQGSKILELDLPRGRYRLNWTAEGDDLFILYHEEAENSVTLTSGNVPTVSHSEKVVRLSESGRHIFSVHGDKLTWKLTFVPL